MVGKSKGSPKIPKGRQEVVREKVSKNPATGVVGNPVPQKGLDITVRTEGGEAVNAQPHKK
jgi:hypothetical protein